MLSVVPYVDRALVLDHPVLLAYEDLREQEKRAGIKPGTPIIISPDYEFDEVLARYFLSCIKFRELDASTREEEGRAIKNWLSFLDSQYVHWRDANAEHFIEYRDFRTDRETIQALIDAGDLPGVEDAGAVVVSMSTFRKAHYALLRLYRWAEEAGHAATMPIPTKVIVPEGRSDGAAKSNWLLPRAYYLWREVGLGGRGLARDEDGRLTWGPEASDWKGGVTASRNVAYANMMITTALRRREQGTMLLPELPTSGADGRLAFAVGKNRRGRAFTPNQMVLRQVQSYVRLQRAAAVRRAQAEGRYETQLHGGRCLVVNDLQHRNGTWWYSLEQGASGSFETADESIRHRLYRRGESGEIEPLALWLGEDGMPMQPRSWNRVFGRANARVRAEFARLGAEEEVPQANPHSLRFTFALYVLAALHRRIDARDARSESEDYVVKNYGLAYDTVRDLLGHKNRQTTVDIYLEPVQGLRRAALLNSTVQMDLSEVIGMLVVDNDRVIDVDAPARTKGDAR